jgi:hypothetical protein
MFVPFYHFQFQFVGFAAQGYALSLNSQREAYCIKDHEAATPEKEFGGGWETTAELLFHFLLVLISKY